MAVRLLYVDVQQRTLLGMVYIGEASYETLQARCEHCGHECTFSRVDDLGTTLPIAGRDVTCLECGKAFWITGDRVGAGFEYMIDDARAHFESKRYMPAIASTAQAWEMFFTLCVLSTYVYEPFRSIHPLQRRPDQLNARLNAVRAALGNSTWSPLRNVVVNMLVAGGMPVSLADATKEIAGLSAWRNTPSDAAIANVSNPADRGLILELQSLTVGDLRNRVIHKYAYRPLRAEVEKCLCDEVDSLYRVKHRLNVGDYWEH